MKPSDYVVYCAERFDTVEEDSTFYACPTARTVENWEAKPPDNFVVSVKVPQTITHDKTNPIATACSNPVCFRPRIDDPSTRLGTCEDI